MNIVAEGSLQIFHPEVADDAADLTASPSPEYLRAREQAERSAAKRSSSARARAIHQELAQMYHEQRLRTAKGELSA